jgi:hypothetical protein
MSKVKALKIKISGSYNSRNDTYDFEGVEGIVPFTTEELALYHVRGRHAVIWLTEAKNKDGEKLFKARIENMRQILVDNIEEVMVDQFSYVGKDPRDMDYKEIQDLALAKDLRLLPLPKELSGVSLREMREKAYLEYMKKVKNTFINVDAPDYSYDKLPKISVDQDVRVDDTKKFTNEEIIDVQMGNKSVSEMTGDLTLNDLKQIADEKGIKYHHFAGFDKLHAQIFGEGGELK